MTVLDNLDGVVVRHYAEREITFFVSFYIFSCRVVQSLAVKQEVNAFDGDAGAFVCHVAGEATAVGGSNLVYKYIVGLFVECYVVCVHFGLYLAGSHFVRDACCSLIRQFVGNIVTALVGDNGSLDASSCNVHRDVGDTCSVVEAYVTLQTTGVLTCTVRRVGMCEVLTFAIGCRTNPVLVRLQR